jgi:hypothetical protein
LNLSVMNSEMISDRSSATPLSKIVLTISYFFCFPYMLIRVQKELIQSFLKWLYSFLISTPGTK